MTKIRQDNIRQVTCSAQHNANPNWLPLPSIPTELARHGSTSGVLSPGQLPRLQCLLQELKPSTVSQDQTVLLSLYSSKWFIYRLTLENRLIMDIQKASRKIFQTAHFSLLCFFISFLWSDWNKPWWIQSQSLLELALFRGSERKYWTEKSFFVLFYVGGSLFVCLFVLAQGGLKLSM